MFGMKKNVFQKADLVRQMIANSLGRDFIYLCLLP